MKETHIKDDYNTELYVYEVTPEGPAKGIVQILHGAGEHAKRYEEVMHYLKNEGFIVVAHDQHGHGKTNGSFNRIHFGDRFGDDVLIQGAYTVYTYAKNIEPSLPIFAIGHSMGSFVLRALTAENKDLYRGIILTGSPYISPIKLSLSGMVASIIKRFRGPGYISPRFTKIIQDAPFKSMKKNGLINQRHEWTTTDLEKQNMILNDPLGGRPLTIAAQLDVINIIKRSQKLKALKKEVSTGSVTLFCGEEDAMCHYGDSVKRLHGFYQKVGITNLKYRIYANARHELHNELIRPKVMHDIVQRFQADILV